MFNKGDKVSVLDEAINGVVISTKDKEVTIETEDGFMMTFCQCEILKVNDTSNLMDSIKRINRDEIERKSDPETEKFCQRAQR
jgi:preprotein translocase subunit YajC